MDSETMTLIELIKELQSLEAQGQGQTPVATENVERAQVRLPPKGQSAMLVYITYRTGKSGHPLYLSDNTATALSQLVEIGRFTWHDKNSVGLCECADCPMIDADYTLHLHANDTYD